MKAKSLMVLGTSSGVGKSVVAAGLCRLFSDLGFRVAPFKAQNMSNNSFVTQDGGEIGRAQAVQAECARVTPTVDMNPVLLKPSADNCSQVVIQGKAVGNFAARHYYAERERWLSAVRESYERLASQYEILVIEGAGSPAEMNLKQFDLVNMKMAEMADAQCVLVADIDRGGVFASLIGTVELLDPAERARIAGFIINKFRGDATLFKEGVDFIEKRTGKKVWGILPYDSELWIQEEDGATIEQVKSKGPVEGTLDIAIVQLPRISNFTDFEILQREPGVNVRYVKDASDFGNPDLLILPGTKATIADFRYLSEKGFVMEIKRYAERGGRILGICGGYQMMGKAIRDPEAIESDVKEIAGLGIFDMITEFKSEKILKQVSGKIGVSLFGANIHGSFEGYEIHMGRSEPQLWPHGQNSLFDVHPSGRFAGTYIHGIFDDAEFRGSFLNALAASVEKKRVSESALSFQQIKEANYSRLKEMLMQNLSVDVILSTLCLQLTS